MGEADKVWMKADQATVTGVLKAAAARQPDKVYLDFQGETHTYAEVLRDARRLAKGLRQLGVKAGETVSTVLDNNYDAVLAWYAINLNNAISVPVNTAYKGEFLRHQIADCGAHLVIAEKDYAQRVADIAAGLPALRTLVVRDPDPQVAIPGVEALSIDDIKPDETDFVETEARPGDISMLIYTAGTTGPSKGCMISHNFACNLGGYARRHNVADPDQIAWTALPLFHFNATAGSVLGTAIRGTTVAIYPRFSLSNFWPDIERSRATSCNLLGSMIPLIAQAPDTEVSKRCYGQLKTVQGAPFPAELQEIWERRFGVKSPGAGAYGFTEACVLTSLPAGATPKPGSSGMRNDDFDVRIVDEDDNELPAGVSGEIVCRPKKAHVMFEGYWNRPADTLKIMRNMWLHTGDIGRFDEDGFFYFVDRKKDYLRRRGENISSFEMETAFRAHPDIEDVAVHAVFSEMGEDDLKVTATLKPGAGVTEEALCAWSVERVPYFAVPRYIEFRQELPRNPVGRVLKYQLRDEGCTAGTWDREKSTLELAKR